MRDPNLEAGVCCRSCLQLSLRVVTDWDSDVNTRSSRRTDEPTNRDDGQAYRDPEIPVGTPNYFDSRDLAADLISGRYLAGPWSSALLTLGAQQRLHF